MKAVWKRRWLKALRSGEYQQTQHYLRRLNEDGEKSFCCLGVLCDIAGVRWDGLTCKFGEGGLNERGEKEFGLTADDQEFLIDMNDIKERSFKQIANSIEKRL